MPINYVSTQGANITNNATVYNPTTASVQVTLAGVLVTNKTSSPVIASVGLTNASATVTTYLAYNILIPAGNTLDIIQAAKVYMVQNQVLSASATGAVDVTVSSIEVS
jgi:hypothetical protein